MSVGRITGINITPVEVFAMTWICIFVSGMYLICDIKYHHRGVFEKTKNYNAGFIDLMRTKLVVEKQYTP